MTAYLIAWNPKRWQWDDLAGISEAVAAGEADPLYRSCGNPKRIQKGDRVFFWSSLESRIDSGSLCSERLRMKVMTEGLWTVWGTFRVLP